MSFESMAMTASTSPASLQNIDLRLTRTLDAPQDLVFEVWTEPKHLINWWGPSGFTLPFCEVDLRVGGAYRFCMLAPDGSEHWVTGEYRTIAAPDRLTFTWRRETSKFGEVWCDTVVNVTFEEDTKGRTTMTLIQTGFAVPEHCTEHRSGWSECLDRLVDYVSVPTAKEII